MSEASVPRVMHALGVQRSGTNFAVELVRQNLQAMAIPTGDRSVCWKHALPRERTPAQCTAAEAVRARPDVVVALVAKHPLHWIASVTVREPQDLYLKRPALLIDGRPDLPSLMAFYHRFYSRWLEVLDQRALEGLGTFSVLRYESLLVTPEQELAAISEQLSVGMPEAWEAPERVPYSRPTSAAALLPYVQGAHGLEQAVVEAVQDQCDPALLERLGYAPDVPQFTGAAEQRSPD